MQFTDLLFLFTFLPFILAAYYIARGWLRQLVLLCASLLFYACGSPTTFLHLLISLIVNLILIKLILFDFSHRSKKEPQISLPRRLLILGVIFNVGALGYYKYADFFLRAAGKTLGTTFSSLDLLIPMGISFYTFKAVSLMVDVYRGRVKEASVISICSYLSFFTQLQSGPISRYEEYAGERTFSFAYFSHGTVRFMQGFAKKIVLADVLNHIVVEVFDQSAALSAVAAAGALAENASEAASLASSGASTPLIWLGSLCFSLQLYFDFSGYSDMAIGLTNMLGIPCSENFTYPYATTTISEFWRKWHITLGSWFRDYVYIPLGGSRGGKIKLLRNLFVVWILTGLWHGAGLTFIVWGLMYFVMIAVEKFLKIPEMLGKTDANPLSSQSSSGSSQSDAKRLKSIETIRTPNPGQYTDNHEKKNTQIVSLKRICYRLFVLFFINCGWIVFRSANISQALGNLRNLFVFTGSETDVLRASFLLTDYLWFILAALILAAPIVPALQRVCTRKKATALVFDIISAVVIAAAFILALSFVISGQNNPFLYGNF